MTVLIFTYRHKDNVQVYLYLLRIPAFMFTQPFLDLLNFHEWVTLSTHFVVVFLFNPFSNITITNARYNL